MGCSWSGPFMSSAAEQIAEKLRRGCIALCLLFRVALKLGFVCADKSHLDC